jgi:hypothetical protein
MPPNGFIVQFLNQGLSLTTGPYHDFLANVVIPHIGIFAELVRLGEVVTGCLLVLGAFTRLGGLIGIVLALDYLSAKGGLAHVSMWSGIDAAAIVLSAINLVLPTGRVLGVDAILGRAKARETPVLLHAGGARAEFVDEPPMSGPTAPHT